MLVLVSVEAWQFDNCSVPIEYPPFAVIRSTWNVVLSFKEAANHYHLLGYFLPFQKERQMDLLSINVYHLAVQMGQNHPPV